MRILINRYHPVCEDICLALTKLGHKVTLSINDKVRDHYGCWKELGLKLKEKYKNQFDVIFVNQSLALIKAKQFDLVGCDGVFDSDQLIMDVCKVEKVPFFNINGYPGCHDEPSDNILSLGNILPTIQYNSQYPTEGHKKELDWKNIAQHGKSYGKNICIFYPCFFELKQDLQTTREKTNKFISGIHRYEECNKYNYEVFKQVQEHVDVENFDSKSHDEFIQELKKSKGLLMLKSFDEPGISLFEALLNARPVFTMRSYVLASMNQNVLIDDFNAVVADSVGELIHRMKTITDADLYRLGTNAYLHAEMLTRFERQKNKLQTFLENCVK